MFNEFKRAFTENKRAIYIAIVILIVSMVLGYFFEPYLYKYLNPVVEDLTQKVQSGVVKLTFADIFLNNFKIICEMFILGLLFCFSAVILSFNGFFVGYYVAFSGNLFEVLLYIIPHGIFELSSCALACASGFVLFNFLYKFLKALLIQEDGSFKNKLANSFDSSYDKLKQACILFVTSVILLIIAGFVEAYLTIPIAEFVIGVLG
ncbi:membrane protein [Methanobrevibacter sp. YE315]|uniref:stage II sporulation protein M n=1 Tax=Methanobrevibacter sp. YE315 TaxID=1609968 RepID=UPI000764D36C|nr:stage II sporulation protein M [Methanobrevibacter sp. YE315]AMD17632.1 membrane protein [Methanobrevibacter sp. YE315]